jgi:hypothetical protein
MAPDTYPNEVPKVRYRLQGMRYADTSEENTTAEASPAEIELIPLTSIHPICIALLLDGARLYELPPIEDSQGLRWRNLSLPL